MNEEREKVMSARAGGRETPAEENGARLEFDQMNDSRRAALNLMEDAIAARKEAETMYADLQASEEKYRMLYSSMDEGYCIIEFFDGPHGPLSDYVHIEANPAYTVNAGIPDIIGQKVREMVPDEADGWVEIYRKVLLTGEPVRFERELVATGRQLELSAFRIEPAELRQVAVLFKDITMRKRAEEGTARLAAIVEASDDAIISKDLDGIIKTWNTGAEKIFGYTAAEAVGRPVTLLMPPDRLDEEPYILERIRHGETVVHYETVRRRKDGSQLHVSLTVSPIRDESGKVIGASMVARDISDRIEREIELRQSYDDLEIRIEQRTNELLVTNLALSAEIEERKELEQKRIELVHKIVTTQEEERERIARDLHDQLGQRLTALRLKLAHLRDNAGGPALDIADSVRSLQELSEQIDREIGFLAAELRPSMLDDLGLREALDAYTSEWSRHFEIPLHFHCNLKKGNRLPGDTETHLYRIVQEALNNTAKYAEAGEVMVTLERMADEVILVIGDDGVGFDAEARRVHESGRGLGLVGMAERAELIRAKLTVESQPGAGTSIIVRLPVRDPAAQANVRSADGIVTGTV